MGHRYWRVHSMTSANPTRLNIAEIHLRETIGGADLVPVSVTGSAGYSGTDVNYAIDGNPATYWQSLGTVAGNVRLTFDYGAGNEPDFGQMWLQAPADASYPNTAADYTIAYSDDNVTWFDLESGTFTGWEAGEIQYHNRTSPTIAVAIEANKASVLAPVNFPTESIQANQVRVGAVLGADPDFEANKVAVLVVCRGRTARPALSPWTFTLDGHEYLAINTYLETLIYDFHAERWYVWGSSDDPIWNPQIGQNWNANLGALLENPGVSNVVCGDGSTNALYFLDPDLDEDYSPLGEAGASFQRTITGQLVARGNAYVPLSAVEASASDGDIVDASNMNVELFYSDDRGHSYESAGAIPVTLGEYSPLLQWRSLGSYTMPGRLLRLTDYGALKRVDDWRTPDNG